MICPEVDPPDMKASIQAGLRFLKEQFAPTAAEHWMTAPADLPDLQSEVIDQLIRKKREKATLVARYDGHESHPLLLPWSRADEVFALGENEGLNALLQRQPLDFVDFAKSDYAGDIDTPEDYRRLRERH